MFSQGGRSSPSAGSTCMPLAPLASPSGSTRLSDLKDIGVPSKAAAGLSVASGMLVGWATASLLADGISLAGGEVAGRVQAVSANRRAKIKGITFLGM